MSNFRTRQGSLLLSSMLSVPFLEPLQAAAEEVQVLLKNMKALVRLGLQFQLKRTYLVVRERKKQLRCGSTLL